MLLQKVRTTLTLPQVAPLRRRFSCAAVAIILFLAFCTLTFYLPPCSSPESYWGAIADKHARLESSASPKLILVGGSNLAFGVNSSLIEKALKMPVINMGLSANLGLRFMLEEVKESLRAGDIILISPEHQLFFGLKDGCKDVFRVVQAYPPAWRWLLSAYVFAPENFPALLQNFKELLSAKWRWWYKHLPQGQRDQLFSLKEESRQVYDAHGDYQTHKGLPPQVFEDQEILSPFDPGTIRLLNDFSDFVTAKGARVLLIPPPTAETSFHASAATVDALYQSLKHSLKIPVIAERQKYIFSRSLCFDSPYHLLFNTRSIRTAGLIEDLKEQLNK